MLANEQNNGTVNEYCSGNKYANMVVYINYSIINKYLRGSIALIVGKMREDIG